MILKQQFGTEIKTKKINNKTGKFFSNQRKLKRGHTKEVFSISWSDQKNTLVSGGLDGLVIIWDALQGQQLQNFKDTQQQVKIVSIDFCSKFILTFACDKKIRIYKTFKEKYKMIVEKSFKIKDKNNSQIFSNDWDLQGLFREAQWAPDGSFFLVPQGLQMYTKNKINCAFAFARGMFEKPQLVIPNERPVLMIRFSPVKIKIQNEVPLFQSKFRMFFAIATCNSVTVYQSTKLQPLFFLQNIHYSPLTDLTWFQNEFLFISSMDGYISIAQFENLQIHQQEKSIEI